MPPVLHHAGQQRLQPVLVALAVRVEEGEDARGGRVCSLDTRPHQPLPLVVAQNSNLLDCSKLLTVGRVVTEVVHKDNLLDEVFWTPVKDADDGTKEGGASLVVEGDDDGSAGHPKRSLQGKRLEA